MLSNSLPNWKFCFRRRAKDMNFIFTIITFLIQYSKGFIKFKKFQYNYLSHSTNIKRPKIYQDLIFNSLQTHKCEFSFCTLLTPSREAPSLPWCPSPLGPSGPWVGWSACPCQSVPPLDSTERLHCCVIESESRQIMIIFLFGCMDIATCDSLDLAMSTWLSFSFNKSSRFSI